MSDPVAPALGTAVSNVAAAVGNAATTAVTSVSASVAPTVHSLVAAGLARVGVVDPAAVLEAQLAADHLLRFVTMEGLALVAKGVGALVAKKAAK